MTVVNKVRFGNVEIRNYGMTMGDNPSVSIGTPVGLDWEFWYDGDDVRSPPQEQRQRQQQQPTSSTEVKLIPVDAYEASRRGRRRRKLQHLLLSYVRRQEILLKQGFTEQEIRQAERAASRGKLVRKVNRWLAPDALVREPAKSTKLRFAYYKNQWWLWNYRRGKNNSKINQ